MLNCGVEGKEEGRHKCHVTYREWSGTENIIWCQREGELWVVYRGVTIGGWGNEGEWHCGVKGKEGKMRRGL